MAIVALCVAAIGFIAVQPVFWTMPTQLLSGTALAAGKRKAGERLWPAEKGTAWFSDLPAVRPTD